MAVSKSPEKYRTSDGREFRSQEEAERHEKLHEAADKYKNATWFFCAALAETQRTADDQPFELKWGDYYVIAHSWAGLPQLRKVQFSRAYWQEFALDDDSQVRLILHETERQRDGGKPESFKPSELFASEKEAKKALLEAQEERLQQLTEDVGKLRNEVTKDK